MSVITAIVSHVCIIALTGMLYISFSPHNKSLASIGTLFRLGEGIVLIYNEFIYHRLLNMAREYALVESDKNELREAGNLILQNKSWGFLLGLLLLSIGALAYSVLLVNSGAIPVKIAWLGIVAGIISVIGTLIKFAVPSLGVVHALGLLLMMIFEILFGGWLFLYSYA